MISDREKFLMREAMKSASYYPDLDSWLKEVISDVGHTVEQHLSHDADRHALRLSDMDPSDNG